MTEQRFTVSHAAEAVPQLADRGSARRGPEPIAIVGMACLYPDAPDLDTYWRNIMRAASAVREVPAERWSSGRFFDTNLATPDRVVSKWGGFIEPVGFDAMSYGIPPNSLGSIEPLQLLMLEVVRRALRHADFENRPFAREKTCVVIGTGGVPCDLGGAYETRALVEHYLDQAAEVPADVRETVLRALHKRLPALTEDSFAGVLPNVTAGRVANRFDLGGMNCTVDAACGSSLAALDTAVKELRFGHSDVAVVGAADGQQNLYGYLLFSKTRALSPRGRCRPFDEQADGIAISDGVAALVLKRLADAERDGDRIYALVRDVAGSSDGRDKSMTAPSVKGQRRALQRAYERLEFTPADVELVEAHGTGTVAGDRAELDTLCEVYAAAGATPLNTQLGSVKSLIGHTKNAAGLAGLIKSAMGLHHRTLPPTLFEKPNATISNRAIPFYLSGHARPWLRTDGQPRRAAVSAFGFGGTNFHAVLEEYAPHAATPAQRPAELLLMRAAGREALVAQLTQAKELALRGDVRLADLAFALDRQERGADGQHRAAFVATDGADFARQIDVALKALQAGQQLPQPGPVMTGEGERAPGRLAFLFPGQGSQSLDMLGELALYFPVVRERFEQAGAALADALPHPLLKTVFPVPAYDEDEAAQQRRLLDQTWTTQPALGAADMAMHALLGAFGVQPDMAAGHSYGEYVALCAAGVYSEHDLLRLSELRGRLITETQGSDAVAMLAVNAGRASVEALLPLAPGVSLAIVNAPQQTVVGGAREAIAAMASLLEGRGVRYRRIAMSAGFHIPEAKPAAVRFGRALSSLKLLAPRLPVVAGVTARTYPSDDNAIRQLLIEQFTKPIHYKDQIEALWAAGVRTFIEVGPGQVLTSLARQTLDQRDATLLAPQRTGSNNPYADLLTVVGRLYADGLPINRAPLYLQRALPGHDLQRLAQVAAEPRWRVDTASVFTANGRLGVPAAGSSAAATQDVPLVRKPPAAEVSTDTARWPIVAGAPAADPAALQELQALLGLFRQQQNDVQREREALLARFFGHAGSATPPTEARPAFPPVPKEVTLSTETATAVLEEPPQPAADADQVQALLLRIISERTGYPVDMLDLDHGIEADLGVDSIKRTEILAALRDQLGFTGSQAIFDEGSKLRTLRDLVRWSQSLQAPLGRQADQVTPAIAAARPEPTAPVAPTLAAASDTLHRPAQPDVQAVLFNVVSERTGYPVEMLALDHHMEADLGIDSIKLTEIGGAARLALKLQDACPSEAYFGGISRTRSLLELRDWLASLCGADARDTHSQSGQGSLTFADEALARGSAPSRQAASSQEGESSRDGAAEDGQAEDGGVLRLLVRAVESPSAGTQADRAVGLHLRSDSVLLITEDEAGQAQAIARQLREDAPEGCQVLLLRHGSTLGERIAHCYEADLLSTESLGKLRELLRERHGPLTDLWHFQPFDSSAGCKLALEVRGLLCLAKVFGADLRAARGTLATLTGLGGDFGIEGRGNFRPGEAGVSGLMKSLAREWPEVTVRCWDAARSGDPRQPACPPLDFLDADALEVGYREGRRSVQRGVDMPLDGRRTPQVTLDPDSVVLVLGGARGIASHIAIDLASRHGCRLIIAGRTPTPEAEVAATAGVAEGPELRRALAAQIKAAGQVASMREVEAAYQRLLSQRQMRATFDRLAELDASFEYHAIDVADAAQLEALVVDIYQRHGRLDGVIHAAGVVADGLVQDKTLRQFDGVFCTKVVPALTLSRVLRPESLRFLVFFSSVAARYGCAGGADYAAANEVLNKLAWYLDRRWKARVVSIGWGPWAEVGMATRYSDDLHAERGFAWLPVQAGCRRMHEELLYGRKGEAEVVIFGARGEGPDYRAQVQPGTSREDVLHAAA